MRQIVIEIPENTYELSEKEISVLHALCFYHPDGMTKEAENIMEKIEKQFRMHNAIGSFKVWRD
jgi:hypothetical protein